MLHTIVSSIIRMFPILVAILIPPILIHDPPSLIIIMLTLVRVPLIFDNSFSHFSSSSKDLNNSSTILGFYSTTKFKKLMIFLSLIQFHKPWVHHFCIRVEIFMNIWD